MHRLPIPSTLALIALLLAVSLTTAGRRLGPPDDLPPTRPAMTVNLNHADYATLRLLPGVGHETARRIILHRQSVGPLAGLEDLRQHRLVGPAALRNMEPWINFELPKPKPAEASTKEKPLK